ncbi:helix-turn-helix domain-containing protein [Shouchella sp. JSM 1781072]|uniref:helix-turn-helix domain-containing protein n=1 Tax=Bacillaceae TaxID=186817 RepID=UPI000C07D87B|nr:helix-turn-helix domain-containing protein [Bacillus sp. Marseille-P3800]
MEKITEQDLQVMIEKMVQMRKQLGISRAELSKRTGLNQRIIRKMETSLNRTYAYDYLKIVDVLTMEMLENDLKKGVL